METLTLHIEPSSQIRSIDLENILKGIRLICENHLSTVEGCDKRNFTDNVLISGVDKGSIIIEMTININISIEWIPVISTVLAGVISEQYPGQHQEQLQKLLKRARDFIRSAIRKGNKLTIKDSEDSKMVITYETVVTNSNCEHVKYIIVD